GKNQEIKNMEKKRDIIFRERAKILSKTQEQIEQQHDTISLLTFYLADEMYGLEAEFVERVIALKRYADIPCTPDYILGMINVLGEILAVIDIKKLFKLPDKGITNLNRVIILHNGNYKFGILCDEVIGREGIPLQEIQKSLPNIAGMKSTLVRGVTRDRLIVINTQELFKDKRIIIDDDI
ncbi:MAG: chemotaxis protein CheW, partial [Candidatus Stygibacter frigidus]|nr:chemotaxis protein CheW [Candidatus Stygibacter frigidus]